MIELERYEKALAFFAHPDDETLAAGATIYKLSELSVDVHMAIPATGIHSRRNTQDHHQRDTDMIQLRKDCEKALAVLGIAPQNIYLGEFPDNEMDKHSLLEIVHWLEEIFSRVEPDIILQKPL